MPYYCPVCRKYSDKFPTIKAMEDHLIDTHPTTEQAVELTERRRKGYAQDSGTIGKTTTS